MFEFLHQEHNYHHIFFVFQDLIILDKLLKFVRIHEDYDPIFRHDIIHHCMLVEKMPERFDDEDDFNYKTRLLQCRRRMDEQNRLGGCLIMAIEQLEDLKKRLEK